MALQLRGIWFNHDATDSRRSALNIRRNALLPVAVPEWTPGLVLGAQSVAAYATRQVDPAQVFVLARFAAPQLRHAQLQVRTVRPEPADLPLAWQGALNTLALTAPLLYVQWRNYLSLLWTALWEQGSDLLGQVLPTQVTLDGQGDSGWVALVLAGNRLREAGVGRHEVGLRWQWRLNGAPWWQEMQLSQHLIYTVLDLPTLPWRQLPFEASNTQLPWIDALDRACVWAAGAREPRDASGQVTRAVYQLGGGRLEYGCAVGAGAAYSFPYFNLSAFLSLLDGGIGCGRYVNCSDCATFVSTMANLLGDDLWQSQMGETLVGFSVNAIRAIGTALFVPPCGVGAFSYHEVAWSGNGSAADSVYDACLELNADPSIATLQPLLATQLRFGEAGEGQYRDLLAAPWSRNACMPRPELRQRRPVF